MNTPPDLPSPGPRAEKSMYAHELDGPGPLSTGPLEWRSTAVPTPGRGQLLLSVTACGVCRSNLHMIEGDWSDGGLPAISPIIPGHEVTGIVVALGPETVGFALGDAVGVQPLWWTCEECEFCLTGREELCHQRKITGEHVNGGYAEFMVSNAAHTYLLPDGLDPVDSAPLFCPGITAYSAVQKLSLRPGQRVAIFGLGGVGHMAVQFALLAGAETYAVGRSVDHLQVARELGATRVINSTESGALDRLEDSMDAVVTFAPSDEVNERALRVLKWGGTLVSGVPLTVRDLPFNRQQIIKASLLGNRRQMREVLDLAAAGKVRTVVERFAMRDATQTLDRLHAGDVRSRAVLEN